MSYFPDSFQDGLISPGESVQSSTGLSVTCVDDALDDDSGLDALENRLRDHGVPVTEKKKKVTGWS